MKILVAESCVSAQGMACQRHGACWATWKAKILLGPDGHLQGHWKLVKAAKWSSGGKYVRSQEYCV